MYDMKNLKLSILCVMLLFAVFSCTKNISSKNEENVNSNVNFILLNNYFLKNTAEQDDDVSLYVIKDIADFDKRFGVAKTMDNKIIEPNFDNSSIIAIIYRTTNISTNIKIDTVTSDNSGVTIHARITKGGKQSFYSRPMLLLSISKQAPNTNVKVVEGKNILAKDTL